MLKLILLDMDSTLAESKQRVTEDVLFILEELVSVFEVGVISGAKFEQFERQLLSCHLYNLKNLHILPTCGTQYRKYNETSRSWRIIYDEVLSSEEKEQILYSVNRHTKKYQFCSIPDQIEDRGSQITWSAKGQSAHPAVKKSWDPTNEKKKELRDLISGDLPSFEVRTGGTTSIDITKKGRDKAFGTKRLLDILNLDVSDCLFFGDALHEGGNDFPIKEMGIACVEVRDYHDTMVRLREVLGAPS